MDSARVHVWSLKLANIVSYFLFASSNLYATLMGGTIGGPVETYLTPAPWLMGVSSVINLFFLGLLVYQFWPSGHKVMVNVFGWRFPALFMLNALCTALYSMETSRWFSLGAFFVLCLVAGCISNLYGALRMEPDPATWLDFLLIHLPVSLYHGVIVVIFVVGAFAVGGVDAQLQHAGVVTKILVFVTLFFLESTAAGYVFYGNRDIAGASMIALGLLAIAQHQQRSRFVHWSAVYVS